MSAIFRTDSGYFGFVEAGNISTTGQIQISGNAVATETYVNTTVGGGIDYSAEINTLSGNIDTVSGDLNSLSGVVDGLDNVGGDVSVISGDLDALELTVDAATGNIDTISGAVEDLLNAEVADDTAFNTVSGSVDTISGDLDTLEGIVDTATGDINEISGVVQNLSASSTTYGDSDVADYLNGSLDTHIIPIQNSTYDIGSAEYKIRHLYLSSNSLYIGGEEGVTGTAISATPEGGIVLPSELNVSGINISGAIGGVQPNAENDSMQWNEAEKKWVAGDKLSTTANTLNTTTGDLYSFYKKEINTISNVSGNFNALNFQPTNIPTTKTSAGTKGEITYDENYVYLCVADNVWKRLPSADF